MNEEDLQLLQAAVNTLDSVEVRGRDNMGKVLGCINALQKIIDNNSGAKPET